MTRIAADAPSLAKRPTPGRTAIIRAGPVVRLARVLTLSLTLLLLAAAAIAAHAGGIVSLPGRLLAAGTATAAAIIAIETAAGATGFLTPAVVAGSAVVLAAAAIVAGGVRLRGRLGSSLRDDLLGLRAVTAEMLRPEILPLAIVAVAGWSWVVAAIRYLPPRSVDDLGHHLPPIFEAAVRGRFVILPLELREWFAYPLNADLLSLWPTLLRWDIRWTDGAQAATALLAAVAIVALAREIGATRRSSLLAALAFLVLPLTLKQATSCYTDISVAAFYGAALWGALRFERTGSTAPLLASGMAAGLLAGTKYHFLLPVAALVPLIVLGSRHFPFRAAAWKKIALLFVLPAVLLSGYWYARNWVVLGNPFHPYRLGLGPVTIFPGALPPTEPAVADGSIAGNLPSNPWLPIEVSMEDKGAGGVDGGLGPIFWGLVLPLGLWQFVRAMGRLWEGTRLRDAGRLRSSLTALQFGAALLPYLASPFAWYDVSSRYLLAAAIPGAALACVSLDRLKDRWPGLWASVCCLVVLSSALSLPLIAGTKDLSQRKQKMGFGLAARAPAFSSPWRYVEGGSHGTGRFAKGWELLDLLSDPPGGRQRPLAIYATGQYPAGFYGTRLQNRIWNFMPASARPAEPDVYFFYLTIQKRTENITYYGTPVYRYADVALRPDLYDCILVTPETLVYVRREMLRRDADFRHRLATCYEKLYPEETATASTLTPIPANGTIVTAGPVGLGLKALELRGRMDAHVAMTRGEEIYPVARLVRPEGPVYFTANAEQERQPMARMKGTTTLLGLFELREGDFDPPPLKTNPRSRPTGSSAPSGGQAGAEEER